MPTIGLAAFLKLYSMDRVQKERGYKKYLDKKGGYDFYWTLKNAAAAMTYGKKTRAEAERVLKSITRPAEIEHNKSGLKALADWLDRRDLIFFVPPTAMVKSPRGFLTIKLAPEFGAISGTRRRLVTLWNTAKPDLTTQAAGVGIHLIQSYLCVGEHIDCKGMVLDLRRRLPYVSDEVPDRIKAALAAELNWVDNYFETRAKDKDAAA